VDLHDLSTTIFTIAGRSLLALPVSCLCLGSR